MSNPEYWQQWALLMLQVRQYRKEILFDGALVPHELWDLANNLLISTEELVQLAEKMEIQDKGETLQ